MSRFISTHPIGTVIQLRRKGQRYTATLHRREYHSEEWRITDARGRYVYSEGWHFVQEYQAAPSIADAAREMNPPAGALGDALPFALQAERPRARTTDYQPPLFPDEAA